MNANQTDQALAAIRQQHHPQCVVCSLANERGWQLAFTRHADNSVSAPLDCEPAWEGYPNCLHGGVITTLLDAAMTNCLFAHGQVAFTAELTVRFREVVVTGRPATVRAWLLQSSARLYRLRAELQQDERVKVTATARFLSAPGRKAANEVRP